MSNEFGRRNLFKRAGLALAGAGALSPDKLLKAQKSVPKAEDCHCVVGPMVRRWIRAPVN
jgi:hypothetical protein